MGSSQFDLEPADLSRRNIANLTDPGDISNLGLGLRQAKPELASLLDEKFPTLVKPLTVLLERLAVVLLCLESRSERLEFFVDGKFGLGQFGVVRLEREQPVFGALRRLSVLSSSSTASLALTSLLCSIWSARSLFSIP